MWKFQPFLDITDPHLTVSVQDVSSWMLVVMVAVQAAAGSIFLFEWLSPSGYNMSQSHNQEQTERS